ncbi:MAG: DUF4981 domain-containing protein [Erysipelotrichaceae bacterium]|nr:DUF4981 domain-containing protein [Erysipelotrichaceae bacterium]
MKERMNYEWIKDPTVYQVNRMKPYTMHKYYAHRNEVNSSFIISLNVQWKFFYCTSLKDIIPNFYDKNYDCSSWDDINVPGHIQLQGYGKPMYVNQVYPWSGSEEIIPGEIPEYNPIGSYILDYELSEKYNQYDKHICFHGVESAFALWVNGEFIGYSEDSFTPSTFDLSNVMVVGRNRIAVQVYRFSSGSWLEDQDFWRFSGIFRDVELRLIPPAHIQDLHIQTKLNDTYDKCQIDINMTLNHDTRDTLFNIFIYDNDKLIYNEDALDTTCTLSLNHPKLWSAENPYLYQCIIEVYHHSSLCEVVKENIGIREFKCINNMMCINGQRIVFHGVNRHEFSPYTGRVITYEQTYKDIMIMKEHNINAIRTSHYPNNTFFYDICDQLGMYVIDEMNLETHGTWSELYDKEHIIPNDKEEWKDVLFDRAHSMIQRDKNHPCILIWSLGNESYGGKNLYELSNYVRSLDHTRLVHYEGIFHDRRYNDTSDIESQMYTPAVEVEEYLKNHTDKPFILCEYAHAMGNSNGGLYKYVNLEKKYSMYQGGFIWDFVDQALYIDDKLIYGGDLRERPSDYDFCGNGIVFADRSLTPKIQEVKYCYQNIDIDIHPQNISITNNYLFTNLNQYDMKIEILQDGHLYQQYTDIIDLEPSQTITINNPFICPNDNHEYTLTLSFFNQYEVASKQYIYPYQHQTTHTYSPIKITEDYLNIGIIGQNFHLIFSKAKGLVSYQYNNQEFIRIPPHLQFFRASTNNDVENQYGHRYSPWLTASLYSICKFIKVEKYDNECILYYQYSLPQMNRLDMTYHIYGDGEIEMTMDYEPLQDYIEMPCFGMIFQTYKEYNQVDYYGYGPEENYIDRNKGAKLGLYHYNVKDNMTNYLYPQECGNRTNVRYAYIHNNDIGLLISSDNFEFSALPYTPYEIENARHQDELPNIYQSVICIYQQQMGVAGDNTWGARTHDEFLLSKDAKHFTFSIKATQKAH